MTIAAARARWAALPAPARWPLAFLALLAASALVGRLSVGVGNAVFLAGALLVLGSLLFIRHGGRRKVVVARAPDGKPLRRELVPDDVRAGEVRRGVALFLLGIALWAALLLPRAFGVAVP
jgi:hypothetical protein